MPIIIFLLVVIVILLVGGPGLLFGLAVGAVALPAWAIWASGILQFLLWGGVLLIGFGIFYLVVTVLANNAVKANSHACTKCGHRQPADLKFCFKCSHQHTPAA
jgi:hypothetical protein